MYLKRIRDLREDRDLYQIEIARILNVTQAQYSRIEKGENELSYDGMIKLSTFYNTSVDYILGLTNIKEPYPRTKKSNQ